MKTFTIALSGGLGGGKDAPDVTIEASTYEIADDWIQFYDENDRPCGAYPQRSVRSVTLAPAEPDASLGSIKVYLTTEAPAAEAREAAEKAAMDTVRWGRS